MKPNAPPRLDLVRLVRARIAAGYYDSRAVVHATAAAFARSVGPGA